MIHNPVANFAQQSLLDKTRLVLFNQSELEFKYFVTINHKRFDLRFFLLSQQVKDDCFEIVLEFKSDCFCLFSRQNIVHVVVN